MTNETDPTRRASEWIERYASRRDAGISPEQIRRYYRSGLWQPSSVVGYLKAAATRTPEQTATVSYGAKTDDGAATMTYAEYDDLVSRLASALVSAGLGAGDRMFVALANGAEAGAFFYAASTIGAVYVNVPPTYGQREMEFILNKTSPVVVVLDASLSPPRRSQITAAATAVGTVRRTVMVGAGDENLPPGVSSLDDLLAEAAGTVDPVEGGPVQIGFTSGTTGFPKGVVNTHEGFDFLTREVVGHIGRDAFGKPPVNMISSPVGHLTGLLWGVVITAYLGGTAVFQNRWSPDVGVSLIRQYEATMMFGAPTFLRDLLDSESFAAGGLPSLELYVVAGAPIPRPLARRAAEELNAFICPGWGMTEHAIGVAGSPRFGQERCVETDGKVLERCGVRVVVDGADAAPGVVGELRMRSPGLFLGYFDEPEITGSSFDQDGWLDTGDLGSIDADGFVTIEGRSKDIIIRGGMNVPANEVENLIAGHPAVSEVAVVGLADERLGERACAFVTLRPEHDLDLDTLVAYLTERGLSPHYLPEAIEVVDQLPKTASGKIRKVELRQRSTDWQR